MSIILTTGWLQRLSLFTALLAFLTLLLIGLGLMIERHFARRKIFDKPLQRGQKIRELKNTIIFQMIAAMSLTIFIGADLIRWTSGWSSGVLTFTACWLGFEIYYYGMHRAMHTRGLHRFHREHHRSLVNSPVTAFSVSAPEAMLWILGFVYTPMAMALLGFQVSLTGWLAYVAYNYWGNILGHVNVEILPGAVGKRANSWFLHAITYHALHHARYAGHYGFGATFMDRIFGSEWSDWPKLQAQVLSGDPLIGDGRGSSRSVGAD
jgi:lathosterol oxidase